MSKNNGYKVFSILVEYSTLTGLPTGRQKPNIPSDPNYIAPVLDLDACPVDGTPPQYTIQVIIEPNTQCTFKLKYGESILSTNVSGNWDIPAKTYGEVMFDVTELDGSTCRCRVTYNNGQTKSVLIYEAKEILLQGPFNKLSKLEIFKVAFGDFSDDFSDDFNN